MRVKHLHKFFGKVFSVSTGKLSAICRRLWLLPKLMGRLAIEYGVLLFGAQ